MVETNKHRYKNWIGMIIDKKYRLISPLGEGGMAMVFLAERLHLRDMVAIKVLRSLGDEDVMRRFQIEAAAAAKVKHANVVIIYDFGYIDDITVYIVMELLEGPGLDVEMYRVGRFSVERTLEILKPVCSAIGAAHSVGLLHRDIKPSNIIIHRNRHESTEVVKVVDFGIAKFFESTDLMVKTTEGIVLGTAEYMSPEQCQGLPLDAQTDVYSLAVVCYQMLSGKLPFDASVTSEYLIKHVREKPLPLRSRAGDLPIELEQVMAQSLDKNPDNRPLGALEFYRRLEEAAQAVIVRKTPVPIKTPVPAKTPVPINTPNGESIIKKDTPIYNALAVVDDPSKPKFNAFVGRAQELSLMQDAWREVNSGLGCAALLLGEPGIGKTHFLTHFCQDIEQTGAFVFQGRFYRTPGVSSFHIIIADLKKFFVRLQANTQQLEEMFGGRAETIMSQFNSIWQTGRLIEQLNNSDKETQLKYFNLLAQVFTMLSRRNPVLLTLDDFQWADESSRELFDYLLHTLARERVMLVASARPTGESEPFRSWLRNAKRESEVVTLLPFTKQEVYEALEAILGKVAFTEQQFGLLLAHCGGNPYFLTEILKLLIAEKQIKFDGEHWAGTDLKIKIPQSLIDLVELHLEKQSEVARTIFNTAAVIGDEFDLTLLQDIAKVDEEILQEVIQSGLEGSLISTVPNTENYRFHNSTVRKILYDNLNKRLRRRLHKLIAEWLIANQSEVATFDSAQHYYEANEWSLAFPQLVKAAYLAQENLRITDLHKCLSLADKSLSSLENLRSLETNLNKVESPTGLAAELIADLDLMATYRWLCGFSMLYRGRGSSSEPLLQQAHKLAKLTDNQQLLGQIFVTLGISRSDSGLKKEAIDFYRQAMTHYRKADNWLGQAQSLRQISTLYELRGDYTLAMDCARAAVEIARMGNDRNLESISLSNEAWMLCKLRRFEEAALVAKKALALARKTTDRAARCSCYNTIAQLYFEQGLYQEAIEPQKEALKLSRNLGNRRFEIILTNNLGRLYLYLNRYTEAENYFVKSLKLVETGGTYYLEQGALHNLVRVGIKLNKISQARAYITRAESLIAAIDLLQLRCEFHVVMAELLLIEGKYRETITETDQSISYARTLGSVEHEWLPWLLKTRALMALDRARAAKDSLDKCLGLIERAANTIADPTVREHYWAYSERQQALELQQQMGSLNQ